MSFIKNLLDIRNIKGPEFYKDFENDNKQLYELEELYSRVKSTKRNRIMRDIINLKIGLEGERAVSYELKNSFIPMICLHDIRIDNAGYAAQMDYILITEYFIIILETKKLTGDIVINESGEFIRRFKSKDGRVYKQEGIYSPISQNERHVRILDNYLRANKLIKRIPIYSSVVLANPKAIINRNKAPKDIKDGIYKYDQLTTMLKKLIEKCVKDSKMYESDMIKIANFLLDSNKVISYDYNAKYGLTDEDFNTNYESTIEDDIDYKIEATVDENESKTLEENQAKEHKISSSSLYEVNIIEKQTSEVQCNCDIYDTLKMYRYDKSKEEGNKPYFIFNNKTLDDLIEINPKSKDELLKVQGFGQVKVDKYGDDIIRIISLHDESNNEEILN